MNDWILIVLTAVYVIATIAICFANWKAAKATRDQVNEMIKAGVEARKPRLVLYKRTIHDIGIIFYIKNIGGGTANKTKLIFSDDWLEKTKENSLNMIHCSLKNRNIFIPPMDKLAIFICGNYKTNLAEYRNASLCPIKISITYEDEFNEVYLYEIEVDLNDYSGLIYGNSSVDLNGIDL